MKPQNGTSSGVRTVIAIAAMLGLLPPMPGLGQQTVPAAQTAPTVTTQDGLQTLTFDTPESRVTVKLPDDIRTGDTISGTLVEEPKGTTPDERAKNRAAARTRMIRLMLTRARKPDEAPRTPKSAPVTLTVPLSGNDTSTVQTKPWQGNVTQIEFKVVPAASATLSDAKSELGSAVIPVDAEIPAGASAPAGPAKFTIPPLGQNGRPVVVTGPFDGSGSTTETKLTPPPKTFIKTSTREADVDVAVIAESPRKAVFDVPQDVTGPGRITITDGGTRTSTPFRNLRVDLSAPKTSLLKGESTELRVTVSGLEGLKTPVPLILKGTGVVVMSGGAYQSLLIQPSQVRNGVYVTTRVITGVQAGTWGATATVVTHHYNAAVQDDSSPTRVVMWNTLTGEYVLTDVLPSGQNTSTSVTGTGTVEIKGCTVTLTHNATDRNITARLDTCANTGEASVQIESPKVKLTIRDRDTRDAPVRY